MHRAFRGLVVSLLFFVAREAGAQPVPDHMQCFRVTDATLKGLKGIVDLEAASTGLAPGCKLGKPKLYCVPATQRVQPGTLTLGGASVSTLPYHGPPAETDRLCYQVKCEAPSGLAVDRAVTDEFGTHELRRLRTELMCKPAVGGTEPPPASGFQIRTPEIDVQPLQNVGQCYYFRTSNAVTVPVKRWSSEMRPVTRHIVLLTTTSDEGLPMDRRPPGTLSLVDCDTIPDDGARAEWLYSADTPTAELVLPADDGAGHPVAIEVPANSSGYLIMHHHNETHEVVKAQVTVTAEAVQGPIWTKSATLATYDSAIAIPPMTSGHVRSRTCDVPAGAQFWALTTHTHARAVHSGILDGAHPVFTAPDWEHPGTQTFPSPFLTFATGRLTASCTFDNPFSFTLRTGDSWQTEEQCVGVGYFFPATRGLRCFGGTPF